MCVCNNRTGCKGGRLAFYTKQPFQYKMCDGLTMNNNNEFESIFIENRSKCESLVRCIEFLQQICLVIRTQIKAEISICGVEMFYIQVSFGPQKITVECKLWCQSSYHMYV